MEVCPACRAPAAPGTRYCPSCGTPMGAPVPAAPVAAAPVVRERPTGVTVLAVLAGVFGAFGILGALGVLLVGFLFGTVFGAFGSGVGAAAGFAVALFIAFFVALFGILYIALAFGMWNGRPWAWVLGLVLAALGLVSGLGGLAAFAMPGMMGPGEMFFSGLPQLLLSGFILWYFLQPGVKSWFTSR